MPQPANASLPHPKRAKKTTAPAKPPRRANQALSVVAPSPARRICVARRFTRPETGPFGDLEFSDRHAAIYNANGSINFEMDVRDIPTFWDQGAVDVLASKYFRKAGVPQVDDKGAPVCDDEGNPVFGPENSGKQWALRLANAWRLWGEREGYFASSADAEAYRDEMAYMLLAQLASPNSPQHFNTGLFEAYGIVSDPEGNWYYDPADGTTKLSPHRYFRSAVSACYIQSVDDELVGPNSIFDLWEREARLFKSGSGTGTNFSNLRAKGERLSGGGTSSGVMSFLRVGDRGAGAIRSGGTTRRAAKMVILDATHPEIEEFIASKVIEEQKVAALIAGGFSADWAAEGGAYDSVSFQNANHSVRVPNGFMQAVVDGADWPLTARTTGEVVRTVKARELWEQIADAAWKCADPGVQYDDTMNAWNTAPNDGRLRGTNPCGEYTHLDDTACNLASLNLVRFFDDTTGIFDTEAFAHAVRLLTITLEISVAMSHYPSALLAKNSYEHRTLGLGYCNLGALLMRAGLAYDSEQGRAAMGAITALMHDLAYATSSELADAVGPCDAYLRNAEPMERVIRNHARAAFGTRNGESGLGDYEGLSVRPQGIDHEVLATTPFANLSDAVLGAARSMLRGASSGRRNMQVTVLAPTGTISIIMSADTTGVEPDFALVKHKKLAGGGYMKIVNASVAPALRRLGYSSTEIEAILTHALGTATLSGPTAVNRGSLIAKGMPAEAINRVEDELHRAVDLEAAFAPHTVGIENLALLGIDVVDTEDSGFSLLRRLGFTAAEIRSSSLTICGHQTVEGAPGLKPEHLAVFDTANYCGDGTRTIAWQGHVKALGAVAAHLSGSASKTVNLPNEATVEDVENCYELAYALGVKAISVYRDGSKLSQVLTSSIKPAAEAHPAEPEIREVTNGMSPSEYYHGTTPLKFKLPEMTYGPRWKFSVGGTEVFLRAGQYPDGTLGEIFIDLSKEGSTIKGLTTCFAIAVSHALQYGVPLEKLTEVFTFHNFAPQGIVGGHKNLKMATSIIDAIFKILAFHYLGRDDLVQVPEPQPIRAAIDTTSRETDVRDSGATTISSPVAPSEPPATTTHRSGQMCTDCGGEMVRSGTCYRCINCGATTGCG